MNVDLPDLSQKKLLEIYRTSKRKNVKQKKLLLERSGRPTFILYMLENEFFSKNGRFIYLFGRFVYVTVNPHNQ